MRRLLPALVGLCLFAAGGTTPFAVDLGSDAQREAGREIYDKYCAQCHGATGDGNGHATGRVKPAPRDFTSGKYKFRTTPSGMLPTDEDLRRVIRLGLPYTSMPGWPNLSDPDVQNVIYYLKTFSEDFSNPEKYGEPIDIPQPPASSEESIARGRVIFEEQGCAACHGELGRSDGTSAPTLTDDWGNHIRSADMTLRWTFRGGPTREDIFRTFSTGLNGTPMPSYFDSLEVEDRWHLVNYIASLGDGDEPGYADLLLVANLDDEIDLDAGPELFAGAPVARFPLVGQIVEPGRNFYPSTTSVDVQAVYNRKEIAFLVRWHDMRAETTGSNSPLIEVPPWDEEQPAAAGAAGAAEEDEGGFWGEEAEEDDGDFWGEEEEEQGDDFWGEEEDEAGAGDVVSGFSDAVALQFPTTLPTGIRKPYFLFGDTQSPADLWFMDLAGSRVQQYVGRGSGSLDPASGDEIEVRSGYDRGEWFVIFKRSLRSTGGISFEQDQFVPIAFSVWDGFNRERGDKRALSSWFYLYVEPAERLSAAGPMTRAALGTLAVELLAIFFIRRRFSRPEPRPSGDRAAGSAIPQGGMAEPSK